MKRITIIGGGASGTLLAANLLKQAGGSEFTINLVEKGERLGLGVAYSTSKDCHLLNVPANKMGAFPEDVEHFYGWLKTKGYDYEPTSFVPRKIFGAYLREVLNDAIKNKPEGAAINIFDDEAVDIVADNGQGQVILDSGEILFSDKIILAFGNFLPPHPSVEDQSFATAQKYFQNPWSPRVYDTISPDDSIFIVGTGLSMVDVAVHFYRNEHRGKISAISTRGLLPAVHRLGHTYNSFYDEIKSFTRITDLLKAVRRHIETAKDKDIAWQAVIDSLRPNTQALWLQLPTAEKKYFMQHLSRYWNVSRHRMPIEAEGVLDEMKENGRLEIFKGRLREISYNGNRKFDIAFGTMGVKNSVTADAVINCIGSESNFERLDSRLVKNLVADGYVRNDPISQGLDALPDGRIIGKNGTASDVLQTLGTALKGVLWESTAIPEIRVQARDLAMNLLSS
jgi:uncharacterized NAD(P)/FAD-binding protein YdhS